VSRRKPRSRPLKLKLKLEPIPKSLWGQNLRTALGPERWKALRQSVAQKRCAICGSMERLVGHEVWKYHDRPNGSVAKLTRIETACTKCHDIIHWGNTCRLVADGKISQRAYLALRRHFRTVNKCLQRDFDRHIEKSVAIAVSRSMKEWKIDWGNFKPAVEAAAHARAAWAANPNNESRIDYEIIRPGHHMPTICPRCGGPLQMIEEDASDMSEGQEADYDASIRGTAVCRRCEYESDG
jgi:hypothetical protein